MKIRSAGLCLAVLVALPLHADEPRPLTPRGLDNLVAFTRLLGYVRHFHPSDQAASADWDRLALAGVEAVEAAGNPRELASALERVFLPVAPTLRVVPTDSPRPFLPLPTTGAKDVVSWEHHGYVGLMPQFFKSERVAAPLPSEPPQPFSVDLGGRVAALLPLTLYRDERGTLPSVEPATAPPKTPPLSANDRATRLAAVALAWNVPQHFYPYFDVVQAEWPAALRQALNSAATDEDERAFLWTLRRMIGALHDGHGMVMHKLDDRSAQLPLLWDWIEGALVVTHVAEGTEGLLRGDVVVQIDGRPTAEVIAEREAASAGARAEFRRFAAAYEYALGPKDSSMQLTVRHPTGETATVTVRRTIQFFGPASLQEPRPEPVAELRPGIVYVDLTRLTDDDLKAALGRLQSAKGILFDVRGTPLVTAAALSYLTDQPLAAHPGLVPVITRPDRQGMTFEPVAGAMTVQPAEPRLHAKAVFLTDVRALSYAETFLAFVEHYRLGDIVGSPTAGTTGNFAPFAVPGGYRVFWTAMKATRYDGSTFHGVGVQPTVPATRTLAGVVAGRDEVLEKAVEVVGRQGPETPLGMPAPARRAPPRSPCSPRA